MPFLLSRRTPDQLSILQSPLVRHSFLPSVVDIDMPPANSAPPLFCGHSLPMGVSAHKVAGQTRRGPTELFIDSFSPNSHHSLVVSRAKPQARSCTERQRRALHVLAARGGHAPVGRPRHSWAAWTRPPSCCVTKLRLL
jgi:hypothetical protein